MASRTYLRAPARRFVAAATAAAALAWATPPGSATVGQGEPPLQLVSVFHAHTRASSGTLSPAQISRQAREAGVDVLFLTENFGFRFRYAPAWVRPFLEPVQSTPLLEDFGIDRYLDDLARVQRANPIPLLMPGVETPPYYYWTGSLLSGDLELHDMQRNVLVFPPPDPGGGGETSAAGFPYPLASTRDFYESLPVVGNRHQRRYAPTSLLLFLPGVLLLAWSIRTLARAGVFRADAYRARYQLDEASGRYVRRSRSPLGLQQLATIAVLIAAVGLLYVNYPYTVARTHPYSANRGFQPAQEVIERVGERRGLLFWSMPEATDYHELTRAGFRVRLSTDAHKESLLQTDGYTGFGGVYADTSTATDIGDVWDAALLAYLREERDAPPWVVGESAFHFTGQAGKRIDDIVTVVLTRERSHAAVFEALAGGHMYAGYRGDVADLRLREFVLAPVTGGTSVARSGDSLVHDGGELELAVSVDEADGRAVPIVVSIVRNGVLHRQLETVTPFDGAWLEPPDAGADAYYRVMVRGPRPSAIVSNPIFVRAGTR